MLRPYHLTTPACYAAQLANPLASHTQHPADLFQRVLPAAVQPEVETENLRITPLQGVERLLDLVRQEAIHRLIFRVRQILGDEALDQRAIAVGVERGVEPYV